MNNTIDSIQHTEYTKYVNSWKKNRDAVDGGDAVKSGGYLSKPLRKNWTWEDEQDWKLYNDLAVYYNGTGRTVDGLVGMVFRTPPVVSASSTGAKSLLEDISVEHQSIEEVARTCVQELIVVGRIGVLVDYPMGDEAGLTISERIRLGRRPYIALYLAESIKDWRTEYVNGKNQLSFVKLYEVVNQVDPENEFSIKTIPQYRILDLAALDEELKDSPRVYRQRIYRKDADGRWVLFNEVYPVMLGENMDYIPFTFITPEGAGSNVVPAPISDMAELNIAHYRNSADYEWGLHYVGSPTAVFSGLFAPTMGGDDEVLEIRLGSRSGIHFQDPQGSAKYLEFTGQGLNALKEAMQEKWSVMAILGARILAPERRAVESAESALIHREGETSVLANIANIVSDALSWCANILIRWAGIQTGDVRISLNTDYTPNNIDAQTLTAIVNSWMSGALGMRDVFYNLKRGGYIEQNMKFEEWRAGIDANSPLGITNGK